MAKKKQNTAKPAAQTRQERRAAQREGRTIERKPEEKRPYTLEDCMRLGMIGNILFVVFIIVCLIYYYSIARKGIYAIPFEIVAYLTEMSAFAFFTLSVVWLDRMVRARGPMKVLLIVYIVVEVILMLLEFDLVPFVSFYNGLSLPLVIVHSLFSAGVAFSLLLLDPQNTRLQWIVGITCFLTLCGMLPGIAGYGVYASILINAFAYIFFYTAMRRQVQLDEMNIDCYGDKAPQKEFSSTMFADEPTMVELPQAKKPSAFRRALRVAEDVWQGNEEREVLTDRDEKFEYEFGVIDEDEDDDDDGGGVGR